VHALFIAAAVFLLARRESGTIRSDPRLWFVLSVQIVWWIAGVANHVFSKGDVRRFVTLTQVAVNPFLIPISLGLVGGDMKTAAAGSLTFTVLTIILSSRPVSVYTAAAGFVFAVGHRAMLGDLFPAVTAVEAVRLAGAYAAAVGVAVAWRVLLDRFGSLLTQASAAEQVAAQVRECEALKRQVTHLAEERQALHEAVAAHVAHLNEVLHVVGAPEEKA
jgi:hypothetical protein